MYQEDSPKANRPSFVQPTLNPLQASKALQAKLLKESTELIGEPAVKAYMIHDPQENKWYRTNMLGFVSWDEQSKGAIWTVLTDAEQILKRMRGDRAKRSLVKTFLLIPVSH